jgi:predicted transcriptional regulator
MEPQVAEPVEPLTDAEEEARFVAAVLEGEASIERGEVYPAHEALLELKKKLGL